jgi:hypothetical protein
MKKYIIENNIDFYSELYKSLDENESENKNDDENNICLITNQPLTDKYVTMICGHKFNYIPLFKDILNHKNKFNSMESKLTCSSLNEIRCPYCRNKQPGVLPYYSEFGFEKINGVNDYSLYNCSSSSAINKCQYLIENENFNQELEENVITNPKFIKCLCSYASKISYVYDYNDENFYCYTHKKFIIKKIKTEKMEKIKLEKKNEKLLEKQKIKEEKQKIKEEKQKIKEEKQKIKEKIKQEKQKVNDEDKKVKKGGKKTQEKTIDNVKNNENKNEIIDLTINEEQTIYQNIVISNINITSNNVCIEILKTGSKKGLLCGCKKFKDELCKRHYILKNKKNNSEEMIVNK